MFEDNLDSFIEITVKEFKKHQKLSSNPFWSPIKETLDNIFSKSTQAIKPILIPPKRNLKSSININSLKPININGENIVDHLFRLTNKRDPKSQKFISDYHSFFRTVSDQWDFEIDLKDDNEITLLFYSDKGSSSTKELQDAEHCGLGLRDLMVILYFLMDSKYNVICIEEPENHMHPEMQKKLLDFIKKNVVDKQIFISTHSNIFLDATYIDKVFLCQYNNGVIVDDKSAKASILHELGYSCKRQPKNDPGR